jgi:hypothetical protein
MLYRKGFNIDALQGLSTLGMAEGRELKISRHCFPERR